MREGDIAVVHHRRVSAIAADASLCSCSNRCHLQSQILLCISVGFALLRKIQEELASGIPSSTTVAEGLLILIGGILLITPGVITDGIGLLFIFPLSRKFLAPRVLRRMALRGGLAGGGFHFSSRGGPPFEGFPSPDFPDSGQDADSTAAKDRFKHPIQ